MVLLIKTKDSYVGGIVNSVYEVKRING